MCTLSSGSPEKYVQKGLLKDLPGEKCIWIMFKYSTERTCSQHLER